MEKQTINVNLDSSKQMICECGSEFFDVAIRAFRVSALESPNGQESLIPVQALICRNCNKELKK